MPMILVKNCARNLLQEKFHLKGFAPCIHVKEGVGVSFIAMVIIIFFFFFFFPLQLSLWPPMALTVACGSAAINVPNSSSSSTRPSTSTHGTLPGRYVRVRRSVSAEHAYVLCVACAIGGCGLGGSLCSFSDQLHNSYVQNISLVISSIVCCCLIVAGGVLYFSPVFPYQQSPLPVGVECPGWGGWNRKPRCLAPKPSGTVYIYTCIKNISELADFLVYT